MDTDRLKKLKHKIDTLNYNPDEFLLFLPKIEKNRELIVMIILMLLMIPFVITIFTLLLFNWVLKSMIIFALIIPTIYCSSLLYEVYKQNKLRSDLIHYWIQSVADDPEKINTMLKLLAAKKMIKEYSCFAQHFLFTKSPLQMKSFPTFWEGVFELELVEKYFDDFTLKLDLIPEEYWTVFQSSAIQFYSLQKFGKIVYTSPIIGSCILADFHFKNQNKANLKNADNSIQICSELKSIVSLVDSEKSIFMQLWNFRHFDITLKRILADLYAVIADHPEYSDDHPTIYHLLIEYSTNEYLKYIAIIYAIDNITSFPLIPEQISKAYDDLSKFCLRSDELRIEKKKPWEKLPIYRLYQLGLCQKHEFPKLHRLYCVDCRLFGVIPEIIGRKAKKYRLDPMPECSICPECKEAKHLIDVQGQVIGVISDKLFSIKKDHDLYIGIWDNTKKESLPAELEKLILSPGPDIDFDWALIAVLEKLPKGNRMDQPVNLEIPIDIILKENTWRILKDFQKEGRICNLIEY